MVDTDGSRSLVICSLNSFMLEDRCLKKVWFDPEQYDVRTIAGMALPTEVAVLLLLLLLASAAATAASSTLSLRSLMYFDASTRIDVLFACIVNLVIQMMNDGCGLTVLMNSLE